MNSAIKNKIQTLVVFTTLLSLSVEKKPEPYFRLAFGSCFKHPTLSTPEDSKIFDKISELKPDAFLWLGDFAYLDENNYLFFHQLNSKEVIKQRFEESYNDEYYKKFRETGVRIYGIWDDHDSGINDSGKTNPVKEMARQLFLNYMDEPSDSRRRSQEGGMYVSYYIDAGKKIKLILLDTRYDNDEHYIHNKEPGEKCSLGKKQRAWLKREVEESDAEYTVIASGTQILTDDRIFETLHPKTTKFLVKLRNPNTSDVHSAEFLVDKCTEHIHGYPLKEFVSSGLTHGMGECYQYSNMVKHAIDWLTPKTFGDNMNERGSLVSRYADNNFGLVDFFFSENGSPDWVEWTIRNKHGKEVYRREFTEVFFEGRTEKPNLEAYETCVKARGKPNYRFLYHIIYTTLSGENLLIHALLLPTYFFFLLLRSTLSVLKKNLILLIYKILAKLGKILLRESKEAIKQHRPNRK